MEEKDLFCCQLECDCNADVMIITNDTPDGYTYSCFKHIGELIIPGVNTVCTINKD